MKGRWTNTRNGSYSACLWIRSCHGSSVRAVGDRRLAPSMCGWLEENCKGFREFEGHTHTHTPSKTSVRCLGTVVYREVAAYLKEITWGLFLQLCHVHWSLSAPALVIMPDFWPRENKSSRFLVLRDPWENTPCCLSSSPLWRDSELLESGHTDSWRQLQMPGARLESRTEQGWGL